jgi:hypothetical protein
MSRSAQWRCFWSWPLGHKWERVTEGNAAWDKCIECGKSKGAAFRPGTKGEYGDKTGA